MVFLRLRHLCVQHHVDRLLHAALPGEGRQVGRPLALGSCFNSPARPAVHVPGHLLDGARRQVVQRQHQRHAGPADVDPAVRVGLDQPARLAHPRRHLRLRQLSAAVLLPRLQGLAVRRRARSGSGGCSACGSSRGTRQPAAKRTGRLRLAGVLVPAEQLLRLAVAEIVRADRVPADPACAAAPRPRVRNSDTSGFRSSTPWPTTSATSTAWPSRFRTRSVTVLPGVRCQMAS